uniref:Uncharacterized protein n=1 Tax=Ascaris lumbricoides TaxID=6252 RepID=A0A0M3HVY1_ASCLU
MEDGSTMISSAESEQPSRPWPPRCVFSNSPKRPNLIKWWFSPPGPNPVLHLRMVSVRTITSYAFQINLYGCLLLLVSMGLLQISLTLMHLSSSPCLRVFASFRTIFLSLFAVQPEEPPTPAPEPTNMNDEMAASRNAFIQLRDAEGCQRSIGYALTHKRDRSDRELDATDREKQKDLREANTDQSSGPETEGPMLIEFHSEPEDEDD